MGQSAPSNPLPKAAIMPVAAVGSLLPTLQRFHDRFPHGSAWCELLKAIHGPYMGSAALSGYTCHGSHGRECDATRKPCCCAPLNGHTAGCVGENHKVRTVVCYFVVRISRTSHSGTTSVEVGSTPLTCSSHTRQGVQRMRERTKRVQGQAKAPALGGYHAHHQH